MKRSKIFGIAAMAAAAVMSLCSLAACGPGAGGVREEIESRTDKYGNTIVTILVHKDSSTKEGSAYQKRVDAFNEAYKSEKIKATIQFVAQTSGVDRYDSTISQLYAQGGGKLADIITFDAPKCAGYAQSNMFVDMTELLGDYVDEFIPASINKYNDKVYGLPIQESSAGFYYNKKLLNDAGISDTEIDRYKTDGWTFEQFKAVCAKLKNKGKTPVDMQLYTSEETATYLLYPFGNAAGGEYVSADGKTVEGYLDSAETAAGFQFIRDCIKSGYTNHQIGSKDFLTKDTVGMYLSSGWTIPDINLQYSENFPNGWGILPYPHASDKPAVSATGSWSFAITNNGIRDKSAAVKLIKWMTSDESAKIITDATGMIPAKSTIAFEKDSKSPEGVLYNQLINTGKPRPAMAAYADFSTEFNLILTDLRDNDASAILTKHATSLQTDINRNDR